jgi:exo-beta-1,3-glucanase (GH17 family)
MNNYGWTRENGKAILITEYGMPTNGTGAGTYSPDIQQVQASNCVKGMTIAADTGAEIFIYYFYHDDPTWLSHPGFSDTEWFLDCLNIIKILKKVPLHSI